jgi:NitT/TauT family transport system substrate-binding protein
MRRLGLLVGLLSVLACGGGPSTAPTTSALTPLQVGYASTSATQASAWVAKEKGIFAKNGLDVTLQSIAGGSSPTAALLSGNLDALQISVEAISARLEGGDIVYVAAPVSAPLFWFVSLPSITDASQLKGSKVAVTGIGTATYYAAVVALRHFGLDPFKDVTLVPVNNVPAIFAALQSGQVQAGALSMPTFAQAQKAGMHVLANIADLGVRYPSSWLAVKGSYAKEHRREVTALVKSVTEAVAFQILHPDETTEIIGRYSKVTDAEVLMSSYKTLKPYLNRVPTPRAAEVDEALKLIALRSPKAAAAKAGDFVDTSFVDQLQKQGFIDRLYAGH